MRLWTSMGDGKMQWKNRIWEWMSIKIYIYNYYLGRKVVFGKWILVVSMVSRLVVILFSVQNVRDVFIVVVLMCVCRWVYYYVRMSLSVGCAFVITFSRREVRAKMGWRCFRGSGKDFFICMIWLVVVVEHLR